MRLSHLGIKKSEETKKKMSIARSGDKNSFWKGGISVFKTHYSELRRARENNAIGSHTQGEWETLKIQYGFKCPCCKKVEPEIKLTRDHIIPLTKGGSHFIENIQPLCKSCNCRKHNKIIEKYQYE